MNRPVQFFLSLLFCFSLNIEAQWPLEKKFVQFYHVPNRVILDSLSKIYSVNFSYNASMPEMSNYSTISLEGTLYEILLKLFSSYSIGFEIYDKHVILFPIQPKYHHAPIIQNVSKLTIIKGRITDNYKQPLPYASVKLLKQGIFTLSNQNGEFVIKSDIKIPEDTLIISYLGYNTLYIRTDTINSTLNLVMNEDLFEIHPVTVKITDGTKIVTSMLNNIFKNYPQQNIMCMGFYRETIKDDENYISIIQALIEIAKAPYSYLSLNDQARIFKGYKNQNIKHLQNFSFKLEGGIYNNLRLDVVKDFPPFLQISDKENLYEYHLIGSSTYNNHSLHIISFKPRIKEKALTYAGKMYIDKNTNALVGVIFELTPEGIDYAKNVLIKKSSRKIQIKPFEARYRVFYRYIANKWYFDYSSIELKMKARSKHFLYQSTLSTYSELVITQIDTTNFSRFRRNDVVRSDDIIADKIELYNDSIWGQYNYIQPEESLIKAIDKINHLSSKQINSNSFWDKIF